MIYTLSVKAKKIDDISSRTLVKGNVEVDELHATFDGEWDGIESVFAVFQNGALSRRMAVAEGKCQIPWEVLAEVGEVYVTYVGYDADDDFVRIVTQKMSRPFEVVDRGYLDGEDPREPTSDAYQQLLERLENAEGGGSSGAGLPEGGTEGQVLVKAEDGAEWRDLPADHVTWDELLAVLDQCGIAHPTADEFGALFTDEDGKIYI